VRADKKYLYLYPAEYCNARYKTFWYSSAYSLKLTGAWHRKRAVQALVVAVKFKRLKCAAGWESESAGRRNGVWGNKTAFQTTPAASDLHPASRAISCLVLR
jgi:hypothetical protein